MRCGVVDSAACTIAVESESLSAFAVQDLSGRDRSADRALMVIGLAPLSMHRPGHTSTAYGGLTSDRYHISAFAVVDFLQTPHRVAGPGIVTTSPTCRSCWGDICGRGGVGEGILMRCRP